MSDYKVFDGGNRGSYPMDNIRESDYVGGYPIKYAAHLTVRHKVMPFHVDFGNPTWQQFLRNVTGGKFVGADTLGTHLLAAGTEISGFAIEIRVPSSISGLQVGVKLVMADGTEQDSTPTDATQAGYYWPPELDNLRLQQAAIAYVYFTGADDQDVASSGLCMSLTPALISYASEYSCFCGVPVCDTEYPDPICSPYGLHNSDPGYGNQPSNVTADFTAPDSVVAGEEVTFTNTSTGAESYSWDFGDGSEASTDENPTHTFSAAGTYQVVLTATAADGTTSTKTVSVEVTEE